MSHNLTQCVSEYNICWTRKDTFSTKLRVTDPEDSDKTKVYNLIFWLKDNYSSETEIISQQLDEITQVWDDWRIFQLSLSSTVLDIAPKTYYYSIRYIEWETEYTLVKGKFQITYTINNS